MTAGERASFERTFRQHYAELCDFAAFYLGSADEAEEVVQDVFFAIWLRREDLETRVSMRAYLYGAVRNHALQRTRHAKVVRLHAEREAAVPGPAGPGADVLLETDESALELRRAIESLPPRTRLAMELRWLRQMSYAEVAEAMRISVKGVEKLVTEGIKELRAILLG